VAVGGAVAGAVIVARVSRTLRSIRNEYHDISSPGGAVAVRSTVARVSYSSICTFLLTTTVNRVPERPTHPNAAGHCVKTCKCYYRPPFERERPSGRLAWRKLRLNGATSSHEPRGDRTGRGSERRRDDFLTERVRLARTSHGETAPPPHTHGRASDSNSCRIERLARTSHTRPHRNRTADGHTPPQPTPSFTSFTRSPLARSLPFGRSSRATPEVGFTSEQRRTTCRFHLPPYLHTTFPSGRRRPCAMPRVYTETDDLACDAALV
jgi:hypothetical protein